MISRNFCCVGFLRLCMFCCNVLPPGDAVFDDDVGSPTRPERRLAAVFEGGGHEVSPSGAC